MEKLALVLSGGGSRGAYQMGAIKAFNEMNIKFDIVTGTSVGALNGAIYVQGDITTAYNLWEEVDYKQVVKIDFKEDQNKQIQLLKTAAINIGLDTSPLKDLLIKYLDEDKIRSSKIDFGIVVVRFPLMQPFELTLKDIPIGQLNDYLIASSSCFPAFQIKEIDNEHYVDGAYFDTLPINLAIKMGATKVVAIDLKAMGIKKKVVNKEVEIITIASKKSLGPVLTFEKELSKRNFAYGYMDGFKAFNKVIGNHYAFKSETYNLELQSSFYNLYDKIFLNEDLTMLVLSLKLIKFKNIKQDKKKDLLIKTIETIGKLLKLDDTILYDLSEFNNLIINKFEMNEKVLDKLFLKLTRIQKVMYFYDKLNDIFNNNKNISILSYNFSLAPDYLLMALYIFVLKNKEV